MSTKGTRDLSFVRSACMAGLLCAASWAQGQTFPGRPLTLIVPWPASGAADFAARTLAKELAPILGQAVIVENVPGAGGSLGIGKALRAPADGHTVMFTSQLDVILAPQGYASAGYQPEDARAIALLGRTDLMLVTRKDLGVDSLAALVSMMKAATAKPLTQCTIGSNTFDHLVGQSFQAMAGAKMLGIPYNGVRQCVIDLVGGSVDVAFLPITGPLPGLVDQGRFKALATLGEAPNARLPGLPLARETKGFEALTMSLWAGLHVHAKVPDDIARALHQAAYAALARPELRKAIESSGATVFGPMTLAQVQDAYEKEVKLLQAPTLAAEGGRP